ncbi:MAG: DUF2189 domain-containing protein [Steroidobacteraceae bacterium]
MADPATEPALPFVAPCRTLPVGAPFGWLRRGWRDMWSAPRQSLTYGAVVVLLSFALATIAVRYGGYFELLALVTGFILIAPVLAVGTYAISLQLERGEKPSMRRCVREERRAVGNLLVFALMLMVVFLVWARAASAIHIFMPLEESSGWQDYVTFFGVGSAVGALFASVVFSSAAFSLPFLVDRRVDTVTAVVTSVNAVLRNKAAMIVWAGCIVAAVAPGFALLSIGSPHGFTPAWVMAGLGLTLPLIGHATWHAYRETIDPGAWPANDETE